MKKVIVFPTLVMLIFLNSCKEEDITSPPLHAVLNPVYGCTDSTAYNYDSSADTDDGSCLYHVPCIGDSL